MKRKGHKLQARAAGRALALLLGLLCDYQPTAPPLGVLVSPFVKAWMMATTIRIASEVFPGAVCSLRFVWEGDLGVSSV